MAIAIGITLEVRAVVKCPECGVNHQFRRAAVGCMTRISNSYTLDVIVQMARHGKPSHPVLPERKERFGKMEAYYSQLKVGHKNR